MTPAAPPPLSRPPRPRAGPIKAGSPTPQHAIMELKQRILVALGKLADRDTQQLAVEELDKIVDTLSADCVSVCLSCLYDSEMQQKSVVKKECVRLFGSMASRHGDLIVPHLSKIIGSIMRRLRDPDSSVREACVDAMATLSSRMIFTPQSLIQGNGVQTASSSTSSPTLTLATFSKPLFDALSEQNKSVQTGAAMCLARVIESARDPPLRALSRLCPRICKFLSNPNFVARPALLSVVGSLSQVGALGQGQLAMVMPCVHEALENSDWATRKAAAETLGCICANPSHNLTSYRSATLNNLESCRFDKVKPVRDSVLDAIQLWKSLQGAEEEISGSASEQHGHELSATIEKRVHLSSSPTASEKSIGTGESSGSGTKLDITVESHPSWLPKFSPDKPSAVVKKRTPAITDKKVNPEFFQKLSAKNTDDWNIEVAVPRKCPSSGLEAAEGDAKKIDGRGAAMQVGTERSLPTKERLFQCIKSYNIDNYEDEGEDLHNDAFLNGGISLRNEEREDFEMSPSEAERVLVEHSIKKDVTNPMDLQSIQKQLVQLEQQQSNLLQIVQDFIVNSQDNMFKLQARVRHIEKIVEEIVLGTNFAAESSINGSSVCRISGIRPFDEKIVGSAYTNSRFSGGVHIDHPLPDTEPASEHRAGRTRDMQNRGYKMPSDRVSDDWNDHNFDNSQVKSAGTHVLNDGLHSQQRSNGGAGDLSRMNSENLGVEQDVTRRLWDKPALGRRGEGPSARSVWQASKDEATLAAIRVAGEDAETSDVEAPLSGISRLINIDSGSGRAVHSMDGQMKGQWSLWDPVLEFVLAGDMESAYTEVLCMEDAMMLVKLMSKTGPVLDQLTVNTASEVLHAVAQLLQQQSYVDLSVVWIQQVADMVINDGADCLEISDDLKKGLLLGLQDLSGRGMLEECSGTSVEQLLQLLMDAWSFNSELSGSQL